MTDNDSEHAAILARIKAEVADSFDEELEIELDDERLAGLLGDMAATQRVATLLRRAGAELQLDHQYTATAWLSEAVIALGINDTSDAMRCLDMAARTWRGEV
jgi:hypothetical protein